MTRWQRALEDSEAWLADLATGPARRRMLRLLHKLIGLRRRQPALIWMPRRDEIGAMLNVTFETASRLISGLQVARACSSSRVRARRAWTAAALQRALHQEDAR